MALITVAQIKKRYSHPVPANNSELLSDDDYCVGGALCKYLDDLSLSPEIHFPSSEDLTEAIRTANPDITAENAHSFAVQIISQNDTRQFDKAWDRLREALEWHS